MRVHCFDEGDALRSRPSFDLLFAGDGVADVAKSFAIHELRDVVFLCEAGEAPCLMLEYASLQVVRYTGVKNSRRAREDICVVDMAAHVTKCARYVVDIPLRSDSENESIR